MNRDSLEKFLNEFLKTDEWTDLGPNGLQVSGTQNVSRVVTAVSASVELFKQAIAKNADTIIVHHGVIWDFERPLYRGGYRERIRLLLENNLNLFAFHLPLDGHPEIGNNRLLCDALGLKNIKPFGNSKGQYIGMQGTCPAWPKQDFFKEIEHLVQHPLTVFDYGPDMVRSVGIISGGAQKYLNQAVSAGLDAFITGEVSEHIMHHAREENIHFISAGHYATETFGIKKLGELIGNKFNIDVQFIDIPNPV
jgi:dinuclear metal center YbgI/SA1388 family protein